MKIDAGDLVEGLERLKGREWTVARTMGRASLKAVWVDSQRVKMAMKSRLLLDSQ
jgi:hypothetical protein